MTTQISQVEQQESFLTTKLQPPASIQHLISRPRLLKRVDQGIGGRLTLICAPAGSGKTTLFTDWLCSPHRQQVPVAWVSLDEGDNDLARFWRYVCMALKGIHTSISQQLVLLLETFSHVSEIMLIQLINLLAESVTPVVLVLDDYHQITDERIHRTLTFLLERMPANMHLVLLTRFEPSLPLARLRVRGQMIEIRADDLRFTPEEMERFFINTLGLPFAPLHLQTLAERTEGWAAGLQLAALAMCNRTDIDQFISSFTGSSRYIVDYLLEEVIGHLPEEIQTFLLSTAILSRLCAPLCASVLDGKHEQEEHSQQSLLRPVDVSRQCQEMLEYLERTNLFLIPLDDKRHWYRYHHLFAEALLARLTQLHPFLITELHLRASLWYEQQGWMGEAIEHALVAKDSQCAAHQIEQVAYHGETESTMVQAQQVFHIPEPFCERSSEAPRCKPLPPRPLPLLDPLSEREIEVLQVLASGAANVKIAQALVIAPATVKRHLSNIFSKLGVTNRTQAVAQARDIGIL